MGVINDLTELSLGLQGFGLTEYESKVYIALLGNGPCTVNQLKYISGVPRTKIYSVAIQLERKGIIKGLEGKPIRFQAFPPEIFHSAIVDGERKVRTQKRILNSLKKVIEKNVLPQDMIEERHISLGSQSLLTKLRESTLKAQSSIKCIVDSWGLHLLQECSEELETICRQEIDIRIISVLPSAPIELGFSSSRMKIKYGKHLSGKSVFIFDNSELILVNSQTGRGYLFTLNELRSVFSEELFNDYWKESTNSSTMLAICSLVDEAPLLLDSVSINKLFIEAVARSSKDEKFIEDIGAEFLNLIEERASPKFRDKAFENALKLITTLMKEEIGDGANIEYDQLTKIVRIELPDTQGRVPSSVWFFALAGLLKKTGTRSEILQNTVYPEARSRVIQAKIMSSK
jgi:sugar-specific transcriptional regulator TrmB